MTQRYVNLGHRQGNEYSIALVDRFGSPQVYFRGFYDHKKNEFVLYPNKVLAPISNVGKVTVNAYEIKNER